MCVLKRIYKIIGHDMYIIDILMCVPYGNFKDKIFLDMGMCVFLFVWVCVFFWDNVSVNVSVYFCLYGCVFLFMWEWVCVFFIVCLYVDMFVCIVQLWTFSFNDAKFCIFYFFEA